MRKALLVALGLLASPACGKDSTGPARIEVEGQWSGQLQSDGGSALLVMTLTETNGTVTGSGNIATGTDAIALDANGTYSPPNVSLTLTAPGFSNMNLTATVGQTQMTGTINGSGFVSASVSLTRQ